MLVQPLDSYTADTLVEALITRVESDDGDAAGLRDALARLGVADGPARGASPLDGPRADTSNVQEVPDDSDGPAAQIAKDYDAHALGVAFHTQLVADGNARAANVLTTLRNFRIL